MTKQAISSKFWETRTGYFVSCVLALLISYIVASHAIDSGSLIEYALTALLLWFAINRVKHGLTKRNEQKK